MSIRAIFIGCGQAGAATLAAFGREPDTVVAAVVDPSPRKLAEGAKQYQELDEALRDVKADVAFISSPSNAHAEQFLACVRRGLHVWVEKPVALNLEDALAMRDAVARAGVKVFTPYTTELHFFLRDAMELLHSGSIGNLMQVYAVGTGSYGYASEGPEFHYAVRQPHVSGGWIFHHFCHLIDWAMQCGGAVDSVFCQTDTTIIDAQPNQEEAVTAILRFRDGGTATLMENQLRHIHVRYGVSGERGGQFIATFPEARGDEPFLTIDTALDKTARHEVYNFDRYHAAAAQRVSAVRRFLDSIRFDQPSPVPMQRSIDNVRVCLALRESARSGRSVQV